MNANSGINELMENLDNAKNRSYFLYYYAQINAMLLKLNELYPQYMEIWDAGIFNTGINMIKPNINILSNLWDSICGIACTILIYWVHALLHRHYL